MSPTAALLVERRTGLPVARTSLHLHSAAWHGVAQPRQWPTETPAILVSSHVRANGFANKNLDADRQHRMLRPDTGGSGAGRW